MFSIDSSSNICSINSQQVTENNSVQSPKLSSFSVIPINYISQFDPKKEKAPVTTTN